MPAQSWDGTSATFRIVWFPSGGSQTYPGRDSSGNLIHPSGWATYSLPGPAPKPVAESRLITPEVAGGGGPQAIVPGAINATSAVTASVVRLRPITPAGINATSAMSASVGRLRPIVPASVNATSAVTASISRARPVVPAAISSTSAVTAAIVARRAVTPGAINASSAITAGVVARRAIAAAISATSTVAGVVQIAAFARDLFSRTVSPGSTWGTADQGGAYSNLGLGGTEYEVDGSVGKMTMPGNTNRAQALTAMGSQADVDFKVKMAWNVNAAGAAQGGDLMARVVDVSNHYRAQLRHIAGDQKVYLSLAKRVAGVPTTLVVGLEVAASYTPGDFYWVRFRLVGTLLRAKAWKDGDPEPLSWIVETTDTTFTTGYVGLWGITLAGSTANPVYSFDELDARAPAAAALAIPPASISASSAVTAAIVRLRPIAATIDATSAITAAVVRLRPLAVAAISASSTITAAIRRLRPVVPAAISATSSLTVSLTKQGTVAITPAAISSSSGVTASLRALRAIRPGAINASSSITAGIVRRRPIAGAISSTSSVTATVSIHGPSPIVPSAITSSSTISASVVIRRAIKPAAITSTSMLSASIGRRRPFSASIFSTSTVTASITGQPAIFFVPGLPSGPTRLASMAGGPTRISTGTAARTRIATSPTGETTSASEVEGDTRPTSMVSGETTRR